MKRLTTLFTIFLVLLLLQINNAQTWDSPGVSAGDSELQIDFGVAATNTLDSAAVDTSGVFSLEDYDGGIGNFATLYYKLSSAGTPKTSIDIYGSETNSTSTMVKLDDVVADATAKTSTYVAFDLAGARAKYYWVVITNEATGAALTDFDVKIRGHAKEFKVD